MKTRLSPSRRPRASTRATTIVWSPPSCSASSVQSSQPIAASRIGRPDGAGWCAVPSKRSTSRAAKRREISSDSWSRMFSTSRPAGRIRGQVDDDRAGQNATSGGSSDTEMNELSAMP